MPTTPVLGWYPLDTGIGGVGVRNGDPAWAMSLYQAARRLNTAACRGRIVFSQHIELGDSPSAAGVTDLFRFRYYERNLNGANLVYLATFAPKDPAVNGNPAVLRETATDLLTVDTFDPSPPPTTPDELINASAVQASAMAGAEVSKLVRAVDGFRLLSLTVFERAANSYPFTLSGANHHVDESMIAARVPITYSPDLVDLRETTDELWNRVRDCWAYSSHGFGAADGYPAATTTFTNLLDGTFAATKDTAGIPCSVLSGGKGFGTTVKAHCAVYAERTGGAGSTGEVRFTSSVNSVDITAIGAAAWYASANTLELDTRSSNGYVRDWDKVDVLGRISAADGATLRVWAIHIEVEP